MKTSKIYLFLFGLIIFFGCQRPIPRAPINHEKKFDKKYKESINISSKMYEVEQNAIKDYIKKSGKKFNNTGYGYWYSVIENPNQTEIKPQRRDRATYSLEIKDLNDKIIYSKKELGIQTSIIDSENTTIYGLNNGLKNIQKGDSAVFLLPSHSAYGFKGDGKKILPTQILVLNLKLLEIETPKQ